MQVEQKQSAVGVVGLPRCSLRLEDRVFRLQIFRADCALDRHAAAHKVAFSVNVRIDAVVDNTAAPGELDGHIIGGGAGPDWYSIDRILRLPDADVMASR